MPDLLDLWADRLAWLEHNGARLAKLEAELYSGDNKPETETT